VAIEVRFAKPVAGVSAAWISRVVSGALKREKKAGASVSVYVTGDREIRKINKKHLRHDYATDVISFWLDRSTLAPGEKALGDIVVSAETARRSARELGLPFKEEFARYLVHGTLHLLGYEDERPAAKKKMHKRQEAILRGLVR
jgi:probable rRNA maturation factor